MQVDVSTDIIINRPPDVVASYASDPDNGFRATDVKSGLGLLKRRLDGRSLPRSVDRISVM